MPTRTVLVTGVSGFVGGALGAYLRDLGFHVTGVSRKPPRPGSCDIHHAHDLAQPIPADAWPVEPDAIIHCAALSSPWAHPDAYTANNVTATANVIAAAAQCRAERLVFISSSSVYYAAGQDQFDITEDTPFPAEPINLYAATKRQAETLVQNAPLPWTILRPRAVFGPGDTVLFPRILRAARRGLLIRIRRPDGQSPRGDLISIANLCHYIERALATGATGVYNLTNNEPVDLDPFLEHILRELQIHERRRVISLGFARFAAGLLETASRHLGNYAEPPLTRFGVDVLTFSKTFDVSRMLAAFGPPPESMDAAVERFLAWQRPQRF
jgi:nucleoside-diphosphate-sugar epimerase